MSEATHSAPAQTRKWFYYCHNCKDQWSQSEPRCHDPCSHCEFDTVREILVRFEFPPIPRRDFDYRALFDGEEEKNECGWGSSPSEAIADLLANWGDA